MTITDGIILAVALATAAFLFSPKLRKSICWQATVTPLASIIGSGFLVAAPLLGAIVGKSAPLAILLIIVLAYGIGGILRFNIRNLEPLLADKSLPLRRVRFMEKLSGLALSIAYVVSVAFYLRLLSSFILHGLDHDAQFYGDLLTTGMLLVIGVTGYISGLHALERLEAISVSVKLSIIAALIVGLVFYDFGAIGDLFSRSIPVRDHNLFHQFRLLAGILLIVQGFETSRYLGAEYDADTRIRTMRLAQIISGIIYFVFVLLALPLLTHSNGTDPDETAIIELAELISPWLPIMLVVAAVMSQFSAAVADTLGGGGLIEENTRGKINSKRSYLVITGIAIALVWFADIFQIISIASRSFAFYYLLQSINAWMVSGKCYSGGRCFIERLRFAVIIGVLIFVVIFGLGAD